MALSVADLDWKSHEILGVLFEATEELTTSEIRDSTGIEPNRVILYRIENYLEPMELVETRQPTADGGTVVPGKRIQLTEEGERVAAGLQEDDGDEGLSIADLPERIEQLSSLVESLQDDIDRIDRRLDHREEVDSEVADSLENMDNRISALENSHSE
jgi:DNA-binding MarR family transcriptional regulator